MTIKRQQTEDVIHACLYNGTVLKAEKLSAGLQYWFWSEKEQFTPLCVQLNKYDICITWRFETYDNRTNGGMKKMWS